MKIEIRKEGKVQVIDLHGRLVLGPPVDALAAALQKILAAGENRILINLRGVPYMDSAGVGELAACKKRVLDRQGNLEVERTPGRYHHAVETLIGLMFSGSLFDDEFKALQSFRDALSLTDKETNQT